MSCGLLSFIFRIQNPPKAFAEATACKANPSKEGILKINFHLSPLHNISTNRILTKIPPSTPFAEFSKPDFIKLIHNLIVICTACVIRFAVICASHVIWPSAVIGGH
jgi:hypothetical protein